MKDDQETTSAGHDPHPAALTPPTPLLPCPAAHPHELGRPPGAPGSELAQTPCRFSLSAQPSHPDPNP